ncbi:hypothetical protein [Enterococcus faecalis]|uniref:hypothetical protein n=1 Tax=Enterococcus faecalis TaxID=1351 RepID=UPI002DB94344|nr:hypothetical protein [Enterococcus faecalis]MEB7790327.1 hypothetical protein [Enterococcus faecalis]MEB7808486.1 hypothetical protein [Enterococcus faecalis]
MEKSSDDLVGFYPTAKDPDGDTRDRRGLQKNAEIETRRGQRCWGVYRWLAERRTA